MDLSPSYKFTLRDKADELGVELAFHAKYNVHHGIEVFRKLASREGATHVTHWTDSHPSSLERFTLLNALVEKKFTSPSTSNPQWGHGWSIADKAIATAVITAMAIILSK